MIGDVPSFYQLWGPLGPCMVGTPWPDAWCTSLSMPVNIKMLTGRSSNLKTNTSDTLLTISISDDKKFEVRLWCGTSVVHSLVFFCIIRTYSIILVYTSLLLNLSCCQLTSTISTTVLLLEVVVIRHGHHVVPCSSWQP